VTATCLGLTSKHLYGSFKDAYGHHDPDPALRAN
jgi:hypothetical protein